MFSLLIYYMIIFCKKKNESKEKPKKNQWRTMKHNNIKFLFDYLVNQTLPLGKENSILMKEFESEVLSFCLSIC